MALTPRTLSWTCVGIFRRKAKSAEGPLRKRNTEVGMSEVQVILVALASLLLCVAGSAAAQENRGVGLKPKVEKPGTEGTRASSDRPELVLQTGHAEKVDGIAISFDNRLLASASADSTIRLWDVTLQRELRTLTGNGGGVKAVAFSPDGRLLASGGTDGNVRLWDVATGQQIRNLPGHTGRVNVLVFSQDGRLLASGGIDRTIRLWEIDSGKQLYTLSEHQGWVLTLAFSPDGKLLASGSADNTVKLWQVNSGQKPRNTFTSHASAVQTVAFSADGATLASGDADGVIRLERIVKAEKWRKVPRSRSALLLVAFGQDGRSLIAASTDRSVKRHDLTTGNETLLISPPDSFEKHETIAFSRDLSWQASSSGNRMVELRRMEPGAQPRLLESNANGVIATAFSPDQRWFATGNDDNTVKLWDLIAGRQVRTLPGTTGKVVALAFSPDGELLASGSQGGVVTLWRVTSGLQMRNPVVHTGSVNAICFSLDGSRLITGSGDKTIKLWETATGRAIRTLERHSSDVNALAISPDGRWLVSGSADKSVRLWDMTTLTEVRQFVGHVAGVHAVAFSPDGRKLASGGQNESVRLWDVNTGSKLRELPYDSVWVYALAFSPDSRRLASGGTDRIIKVWDVDTGKETVSLTGHSGDINSLLFTPDGGSLASGSEDGSTRIWATEGGALLATLVSLRDKTDWLAVTPDGLFDGSPSAWNQILWRFAQDTFKTSPVEIFFNEFFHPDLLADIFAGNKLEATSDISKRDRRQPKVKISLAGGDATGLVNTRKITVRIDVEEMGADSEHPQGSGAQDLRLFRNGTLVEIWRDDVLTKTTDGKRTIEATVPIIAGENRLSAYAFNRDNVKSRDDSLIVTGAESLKRQGTAYILAVGIDHYANPEFNLKYAVADANEFSAELKRKQEHLKRFAQVKVIPLLDKDATKANILAALALLSGKETRSLPESAPAALGGLKPAEPEDLVIVYFAGHGIADESRFYFLPHDLGYKGTRQEFDEESLLKNRRHFISDEELESPFASIDAGHLLLVVDACQSGEILEDEDQRRGPMNSKGLAQLAYEKGINVLTAAQSYQAAIETKKLGHGYLTHALVVSGLQEMAADNQPRDGEVLLREWLDYATDKVPQMWEERFSGKRGIRLKASATKGKDASGKDASKDASKASELRPGEPPTQEVDDEEPQRPRAFYRREADADPLVIARQNKSRN